MTETAAVLQMGIQVLIRPGRGSLTACQASSKIPRPLKIFCNLTPRQKTDQSEHEQVPWRQYDLMKVDAGIDVQMIDHPTVETLAGLSDQQSYWEFDIPALMINDTSFIRNPNYHTMRDDIATLSFDHMREVVTSTYKAVVGF